MGYWSLWLSDKRDNAEVFIVKFGVHKTQDVINKNGMLFKFPYISDSSSEEDDNDENKNTRAKISKSKFNTDIFIDLLDDYSNLTPFVLPDNIYICRDCHTFYDAILTICPLCGGKCSDINGKIYDRDDDD